MPRSQARINTSIWRDEDFTSRTAAAQRMYFLLLGQPTITLCGVVAYTPKRWAGLSSDDTPESIVAALCELEEHNFIVTDPNTEEVLVRSFMRNDGVSPSNPKVWKPAMEQAANVLSERISAAIAAEVARITGADAPPDAPSDAPPEPPSGGPRAGAHASSSSSSPSASATSSSSAGRDDDDPVFAEALRRFAERKLADELRRGVKVPFRERWRETTIFNDRLEFGAVRELYPNASVAALLEIFEQGVELAAERAAESAKAEEVRRRVAATRAQLEASA